MQVVIAPDGMGGLLPAAEVSVALARGWLRERPDDRVVEVPMSDGGEGLLEVLRHDRDRVATVEVAGPRGHPVDAPVLLRSDGTAVVESANACGLALLAPEWRDPLHTTTYGVGQLLDAARVRGARRVLVGLGGSATVDGGAGALTGLGFRLRVADGSGLKVGGGDLDRIDRIERTWVDPGWGDVEVELLADVRTPLADAARTFGPQKGASPEAVEQLEVALQVWARVAGRDLGVPDLAMQAGTGAAGGLGYGLVAGLGARLVPGAARVADHLGLDTAMQDAELVLTGEGRVDATSWQGKVVGEVHRRARARGIPVAVAAGVADDSTVPGDVVGVERAPASAAGEARAAVEAAGARLARAHGGR